MATKDELIEMARIVVEAKQNLDIRASKLIVTISHRTGWSEDFVESKIMWMAAGVFI